MKRSGRRLHFLYVIDTRDHDNGIKKWLKKYANRVLRRKLNKEVGE